MIIILNVVKGWTKWLISHLIGDGVVELVGDDLIAVVFAADHVNTPAREGVPRQELAKALDARGYAQLRLLRRGAPHLVSNNSLTLGNQVQEMHEVKEHTVPPVPVSADCLKTRCCYRLRNLAVLAQSESYRTSF